MRKNCSCDREFFLKFMAEGQEFANFLRLLEQFIQTVKGQNNFLFQPLPGAFLYLMNSCWKKLLGFRKMQKS